MRRIINNEIEWFKMVYEEFYLHTRYKRGYKEKIDDSGNICCLVKRMGES